MYWLVGREEEFWALELRRADLRPHDLRTNTRAVMTALQLGVDLATAMPYVERAQTRAATEMPSGSLPGVWSAWLAYFPVYERFVAGDAEQAVALVNRLADDIPTLPGSRDAWIQKSSEAYLVLGALEAADVMARRLSAETVRQRYLAYIAWARGDLASVRELTGLQVRIVAHVGLLVVG